MKKKTRIHQSIIVLILAAVFVAACGAATTPTSPPTAVPSTPILTVLAPTNPAPTAETSTEVVETDPNPDNSNGMEANSMNIQIGDTVLTATLAENSSANALKEALSAGPITVNMRDYGRLYEMIRIINKD